MAVQVPSLDCALVFEVYKEDKELLKREQFKKAVVSLNRNEFGEIVLSISVTEKQGGSKTRNVTVQPEDLEIHRKFVGEGKLALSFRSTRCKLLLSNAPPHDLVIFVKTMAAKLAGSKDLPKVSVRKKLLSELGSSLEGISPVTLKDVRNMQAVEAGGKGLLKARGYTPKNASPLSAGNPSLKRKRLGDTEGSKENLGSPRLTPKRPKTMARRPLREGKMLVMTAEQRYVLDVVRAGKNVFFTGGAGTGKSFLVHKIIGTLPPEHTVITASTGVAAFQIGGTTLHSFAGIGSGTAVISKCIELAKRPTVASQWRKCRHLIIDEISMVEGNFFKKLEAVARAVRGNEKPFGGIQLILTGDFLQLPPVTRSDQDRRFAFETSAWQKCVQLNIELTQVKRQSDQRLVEVLRSLRLGRCSQEEAELLAATRRHQLNRNGIVPTKLCTHTEDVNLINSKELNKLAGEEKVFRAIDSDPGLLSFLNNHTPVEQVLRLRVGAQVMLLKNLNVTAGLVNGARGAVESFSPEGSPVVRFLGGAKETIRLHQWQVRGAAGNLSTRKQLPLRLAWAFSIHKSQGMTLDCVEVSLSRVFECGQAYVALSRARDLQSLRILDFTPSCVKADPKVIKFYRNLHCSKPVFQQTLPNMLQTEES